jgi:hypothetical protein
MSSRHAAYVPVETSLRNGLGKVSPTNISKFGDIPVKSALLEG